VLLASADPAKGSEAAKACAGCHKFDKGGANGTGPALWDLVERPIGGHAGYAYSEVLAGKTAEKWTYDNLNAFLKDPKKWAPGTKMAIKVASDEKRANLIAYLASLSDSPKPFPSP
jgi:cytochrome c